MSDWISPLRVPQVVPVHCKVLKAETSDNLNIGWKMPSETLSVCKTSRKKKNVALFTYWHILTSLSLHIFRLHGNSMLYHNIDLRSLLLSFQQSSHWHDLSTSIIKAKVATANSRNRRGTWQFPFRGCLKIEWPSPPHRKKISLCKNDFQSISKLQICANPCNLAASFWGIPMSIFIHSSLHSAPAQKRTLGFGLRLKLSGPTWRTGFEIMLPHKMDGKWCFDSWKMDGKYGNWFIIWLAQINSY